jgi:hypothetical protein
MKKSIFSLLILFAGVLLLTGCGSSNKVVCTVKLETNDMESQELTAELDKDNKVEKIQLVISYTSKDAAKTDYESAKSYYGDSISQSGKKITVKDLQTKSGWKDIVGKTKEEFIEYAKTSAGLDSLDCK